MSHIAGDDFINKAIDHYSDMVIRIAFQHTRNKADAEDIAQEVFFSLLKQPPFNEEEHLKAWIIRVTINKSKNFLKSARRRKTVDLNSSGDAIRQDKEEYTEIFDELQKLPEKDRNILYLFYYEGYSAKEIAKIIGKKEAAVFMRLNRAREKLKYLLEESK